MHLSSATGQRALSEAGIQLPSVSSELRIHSIIQVRPHFWMDLIGQIYNERDAIAFVVHWPVEKLVRDIEDFEGTTGCLP